MGYRAAASTPSVRGQCGWPLHRSRHEGTARMDIPLIDIGDLGHADPAVRSAVASRIGAACRSVGFFAISGHGLAQADIDAAFAAAHAVFDLPAAAKRELAIATHGHNRGYVGLG